MALCNTAEAKRNLKNMRKSNPSMVDIDEENPTQIQTYIMLRRTSNKIYARPFMEAWKRRRLDATSGLQFKRTVWLVPRANFPAGLPPAAQEGLVSAEQKELMEKATGHAIDDVTFWLVDKMVPLHVLGKNVEEATYYVDAHTKYKDLGQKTAALEP